MAQWLKFFCWMVSVVCGTTAGTADSKISNRPVTFKSNRNRPIRIESQSFATRNIQCINSWVLVFFVNWCSVLWDLLLWTSARASGLWNVQFHQSSKGSTWVDPAQPGVTSETEISIIGDEVNDVNCVYVTDLRHVLSTMHEQWFCHQQR